MAKKKEKVEETPIEEKTTEVVEEPKEETPKEETKPVVEAEVKEKKKTKRTYAILIAIIVVLLIAIAGLIFVIVSGKKDKDTNTEEVEQVASTEDNGMYPPKGAKIIDLDSLPGLGGEASFQCYAKGTYDYLNTSGVNVGDEMECMFGLEVQNSLKVDKIYFNLEAGSGLVEQTTKRGENIETEDNRYKVNVSKPSSVLEEVVLFNYKVDEDANSENLTVNVEDIVIKTITNDYYKLGDINIVFNTKSDKYYIYKSRSDEGETYYTAFDTMVNYDHLTYVGEYVCENKECEYEYDTNGDYMLFNDGGFVAYNVQTKEKTYLSKFNACRELHLVVDADELVALIVYDNNERVGYYSLVSNKYLMNLSSNNNFMTEDGYIYYFNNNGTGVFYDYNLKELVPTLGMLKRFNETDFYYLIGYGYGDTKVYFYDKDGNKLFKGKSFPSEYMGGFTEGKDGNIILFDKGQFKEYDIEGNVVYESKEYKEAFAAGTYIVVVDKDNMLKIVDAREETIVEFEVLPKTYYIHVPISGYYEYDGKNGVYIMVENENVTKEELMKENDYIETDEDYEMYEDESKGYEYYYIPSTKESGKIATFIGGYAKPVLYLYPTKDNTKVNVTFEDPSLLTTTYPKFKNSWEVTADRNGDLHDKDGKYYYGLYWEEEGSTYVDFREGFYVTKDNAIDFLEEKLSIIGLNDRERNEFIMYWLPILEKNGKNLVYFELTESRDAYNKLNITPQPDSLLRVAIHVKKVDKKTKIKEQQLPTFKRTGFTAVEWGGVIH